MNSSSNPKEMTIFFENIDALENELGKLNKLTRDNHQTWCEEMKNFLMIHKLDDFLIRRPKKEFLNYQALKRERILGELILSSISDDFKDVYLKDFKFRLVIDLWFELERCFCSPIDQLKPTLNELKSIKLRDCTNLKDYCIKFRSLLNQIPNEFLNSNLHNLFSIFYGASVHLCSKRLADKNLKLIWPENKLISYKDHRKTTKHHQTSFGQTNYRFKSNQSFSGQNLPHPLQHNTSYRMDFHRQSNPRNQFVQRSFNQYANHQSKTFRSFGNLSPVSNDHLIRDLNKKSSLRDPNDSKEK